MKEFLLSWAILSVYGVGMMWLGNYLIKPEPLGYYICDHEPGQPVTLDTSECTLVKGK